MPSFNKIDAEHIMQDVYSYPFPEVRKLLRRPALDPDFTLNTIDGQEASALLEGYSFQPKLALPVRRDGSLDLDELHVPIIDRIRTQVSKSLPGLETFGHAYPTPGSSQAMFNLLAEWRASGELESLAILTGEYDGYKAYADSLKIPVQQYTNLADAQVTKGQVWFISNPSALDGNWLDREEWEKFAQAGHQIVVDAAYVGLTQDGSLDVSSPNIRAVLTSPSKVFGVFRYRNTGVTYTREPVASLYGTKWFKDVPALLDTLSLYESFTPNELPRKYRSIQEFLCRQLVEIVDTEVLPSDVLLLASSRSTVGPNYQKFARANGFRFGLAKLFEDTEKNPQEPNSV